MNNPQVNIIASIGENRALGKKNQLLWHISEDLKRFKKITLGHPIIMGRKTYESIGRPLPGRLNIIITRNLKYQPQGVTVCNSVEQALKTASQKKYKKVFIIGGGEIYKQTIDMADKLYLTIVDGNFEADIFFPEYEEKFQLVEKTAATDTNSSYKYVFTEWKRKIN